MLMRGTVDIRDAPLICKVIEQKILEHLMQCKDCRPGVRCIQYMSLKEIQNSLRVGSSDDQKN
jgi:hypothetical protein